MNEEVNEVGRIEIESWKNGRKVIWEVDERRTKEKVVETEIASGSESEVEEQRSNLLRRSSRYYALLQIRSRRA